MLLVWKLVDETQMPLFARTSKSIDFLVFCMGWKKSRFSIDCPAQIPKVDRIDKGFDKSAKSAILCDIVLSTVNFFPSQHHQLSLAFKSGRFNLFFIPLSRIKGAFLESLGHRASS